MTQESISKKLAELFELFESGALSKGEFDLLKSQIINAEGSSNSKIVQENQFTEEKVEKGKDNSEKGENHKRKFWIFSIVAVILFFSSFIIIRNSKVSEESELISQDTQTAKDVSASENEIVNSISSVENRTVIWDEELGRKIIMDELSKQTDWGTIFSYDSPEMVHEVSFLPKIGLTEKEIIVGFAYSNYETNDCNICYGVLSIFEFDNTKGWHLTNWDIAQIEAQPHHRLALYQLSSDNYGLSISASGNHGNECYYNETMYSFIKGNFQSILGIAHYYDITTEYNVEIKKHEKEGYFYLLVEETVKEGANSDPFFPEEEAPEESVPVITNTYYKFNGTKYETFTPSTTDPSLTSINRFYDTNTTEQRQNGVCATCNGTGIQVCSLCEGTGENNMGMECGCVRTYKTEIASGHNPSHPALKWTCLSCGGTGKYDR